MGSDSAHPGPLLGGVGAGCLALCFGGLDDAGCPHCLGKAVKSSRRGPGAVAEAWAMVPSGSMACKRLAPSDPNRMEGE